MAAEEVIFIVVLCLWTALVGTLSAVAGAFFERRKWEKRLVSLSSALRDDGTADRAGRLERLETAVDAIAVELERVGEGQRFVTKVIAERAKSARTPVPG